MNQTDKTTSFLKLAAICSFLGATTTALLIFLPNPPAIDDESRAMLYESNLYMVKKWILFIHPQVNFIASLGVAWILLRRYPLQMILGTLFLAIWAYTEMSQQSLIIDGLNQLWRPAYVNATDEASRQMYKTLMEAASGISDSNYFLVIYGFGLGSLLFGFALVHEQGLGKWLGYSLLFIGVLSLASFVRYYLGISSISPIVNWCYTWIYPYLQPLVRIGIGIWIFREIVKFRTS